MSIRRSYLYAMPLAVAAFTLASVAASAAPLGASSANGADQDGQVPEIVVTAERRSESLQKVPVSESVVSGADARAVLQGGADILALSGQVPGLYIESTTGRIFPRFYIRGLGNTPSLYRSFRTT